MNAIYLIPRWDAMQSSEQPTLPVPAGVSFLRWEDRPELGTDADAALATFEPIVNGPTTQLLMVGALGQAIRVNGHPATRLSVVQEKDHVQFDDEHAAYVTSYREPHLGTPLLHHLGKSCPVCLLKVEETAQVYVCWSCDTAIHHPLGDETDAQKLDCLLAKSCPVCSAPVITVAGYSWMPEVENE